MRAVMFIAVLLLVPLVNAELLGPRANEDTPCVDNNTRCDGNVLQKCVNRSWAVIEECAFTERCDRTNGCELRAMAVKGPGQNAMQAMQNEPYVQKFIPKSRENRTYGVKPMPKINLPVAENATIMQSNDENITIISSNSLPGKRVEKPAKTGKKAVVEKTFSVKEIPLFKKTKDITVILAQWFFGVAKF